MFRPYGLVPLCLLAVATLVDPAPAQFRRMSGRGVRSLAMATAAERAHAHKTILRRFSGKARTTEAGLSAGAAAFVDLFFDLERNRAEIRAGRAPRSDRYRGTPHMVMERRQGGVLWLGACFVATVLDQAGLPEKELPTVVGALLAEGFPGAARVAVDGKGTLASLRVKLLHHLVNRAGQVLVKAKPWPKLRLGASRLAVVALREKQPPVMEGLDLLGKVGDDGAVSQLEKWVQQPPSTWPRYGRSCALRALCIMAGAKAEAHFLRLVGKGPERDRQLAISALGRLGGKRAAGRLRKALDLELGEATRLKILIALVGCGDKAARKQAVGAFTKMEEGREKYHQACALARSGVKEVAPYLEKTLKRLQAAGKPGDQGRIRFLKGLLGQLKAR